MWVGDCRVLSLSLSLQLFVKGASALALAHKVLVRNDGRESGMNDVLRGR